MAEHVRWAIKPHAIRKVKVLQQWIGDKRARKVPITVTDEALMEEAAQEFVTLVAALERLETGLGEPVLLLGR